MTTPTIRHTFFCIDGHTAGNPVRLVAGGAPLLRGASMAERRLDFLERFDWIRTGLCFEPRGHDMMSGGFLYPPCEPDSDAAILFIETSGCLPMCGHGTIGMITFGLENGLITPREPGKLKVEVPAGTIHIEYEKEGAKVTAVRIRNVPAYLAAEGIEIDVPGFGPLTLDVAYGGNYYAIVEPQGAYTGLDDLGASRLVELSRMIRELVREKFEPVHPLEPSIRGVSHVLWADKPSAEDADGRNAVFYGERAIDRSPCGTGTSARLAHLAAKGRLSVGDRFVHESYIRSRFIGRVEEATELGGQAAIVPSIQGSAVATGFNTIWIDREDPFWAGFTVV
ncbi:proline racemase family protein [Sphingomonas sp. S17]|uniref:4-hydroxyproline epimerase n=3 Tax=Bacteria TaxID=2 RepID=A0A7T3AAB7_SPHPI|nr:MULTISPECIES: 4-hydroxyproline epimerase [Sphingomonas]EGI54195.1 proline racemase family protein [Sphingomonas sp. S17]MBQ1478779.1 4-hydroxyproline epimerase [Sphingomonas sp.]MCM3678271.1 4-hydroxyproline epimerase [Sphingomonas paucimobilis]MDG5972910.1 4-hydroxyproline epimerase [Sphingomonas paucimobilis]QPS17225.1 4-hydroxyproline epimerase [Sphingomonas paucimobilis]